MDADDGVECFDDDFREEPNPWAFEKCVLQSYVNSSVLANRLADFEETKREERLRAALKEALDMWKLRSDENVDTAYDDARIAELRKLVEE